VHLLLYPLPLNLYPPGLAQKLPVGISRFTNPATFGLWQYLSTPCLPERCLSKAEMVLKNSPQDEHWHRFPLSLIFVSGIALFLMGGGEAARSGANFSVLSLLTPPS